MIAALVPKYGRIGEIGVWKGDFAVALHDLLQPRELHLIDPWPTGTTIASGDQHGADLSEFPADALFDGVVQKFQGAPGVRIYRQYSQQVLPSFPSGYFDALYIDGDHTYGGAFRDILEALRVVRPGGWIMGHDYAYNPAKGPIEYAGLAGVQRAVHTFLDGAGLRMHALGMDGYASFAIQRP